MSSNPEEKLKELLTKEKFADPTYNSTFTILFGKESRKHLLRSLVNNLLDFTDEDEIISVIIKNPSLIKDTIHTSDSIVDILCETKNNREIAVEMQKFNKSYFLSRMQSYMSSIIANQLPKGEPNRYNELMKDTYVLSICKENIFLEKYKLTKGEDLMFEKTVRPYIEELKKPIPKNKIYWKFYELPRFIKAIRSIDIKKNMKYQWLNFLVKCGISKEIPNDTNDLIKEAYEIMRTANWDRQTHKLYMMEKWDLAFQEKERAEIEAKGIEKERLIIAKNMLAKGYLSKEIADMTGLTTQEIENLKKIK